MEVFVEHSSGDRGTTVRPLDSLRAAPTRKRSASVAVRMPAIAIASVAMPVTSVRVVTRVAVRFASVGLEVRLLGGRAMVPSIDQRLGGMSWGFVRPRSAASLQPH